MYVEDVSFDTVGSPGSFHNSLTVASADNVGITGMPLIFDGAVNAFYNETESNGARMVSIADTYDYVYIDGVGEADEYEKVNAEISLEGKIVIIGTTASVGNKSTAVTFSRKRAETIKNLIVSEGIDASRILVYGAGFSDSRLVQDDLDKNGNLDERIAPYNRAVNILDVDNTIAKSYIDGTYKP